MDGCRGSEPTASENKAPVPPSIIDWPVILAVAFVPAKASVNELAVKSPPTEPLSEPNPSLFNAEGANVATTVLGKLAAVAAAVEPLTTKFTEPAV